jgi:glycosyltransferase 2 family protein
VCSAAGVLYVLLPQGHGLAFLTFCALYSFACMLGIASNAPGGLGVFEATMLKGVGGSSEAVLASLLLFRAIYYLVPFILALALLGAHEAARRWRSLREAMEAQEDLGEG